MKPKTKMFLGILKGMSIWIYIWFTVLFGSVVYQIYHNWNATTGEKMTDPWNYGYAVFIVVMYIIARLIKMF